MRVTASAERILNPAAPRPKQCKLLGARVHGLGLVVSVEANLHPNSYAVLEGADRVNRRVLLRDLKRSEVTFPALPQPYTTGLERVDYGVWDEVHSLIPAPAAVALPVVLAVAA